MLVQSFRSAVAGLPATFWYVWGGTLVNRLGSFVVPFLAVYLTDEQKMSPADAGAIVSLFGLGALLASPSGGWLADRIGRKPTLMLGLTLAAGCMVLLGFSTAPAAIAINTFLLGFTSELFRPAVSAVVADIVPPEDRLRAYAALYWAANLGFAIAPVVAGFMARKSYLALFIADAVTTLVYAGIVFLKVPETRPAPPPAPEEARPARRASLGELWHSLGFAEVARDGVFLTFSALTFLLAMLFMQHNSSLPLEMRAHGIQPEEFGAIIAVNGVLIVLIQPLAAKWVTKYRRSHALALAAVLTGAGFGLNAWADAAPLYVVGVVIWTMGEIVHSPVSAAVVADLAPVHARGRYQGVFFMAWGLSFFLGPMIGGYVMEHYGARTLWLSCLLVGAFIAAGHLLVASPRRRRIEALRREQGPVAVAQALE